MSIELRIWGSQPQDESQLRLRREEDLGLWELAVAVVSSAVCSVASCKPRPGCWGNICTCWPELLSMTWNSSTSPCSQFVARAPGPVRS